MIVAGLILTLAATQSAPGVAADLVVINADVRTMSTARPHAEAIAVKNGRIAAVGSNARILAFRGRGTRVIDAQGRVVIPGFNDAHVHFMAIGNLFSSIDLRDAETPADAVRKIEFFTRFLPKGRWILGGFWDSGKWTPSDPPTKSLIDEVTPDHPVLLYSFDAKAALANSVALRLGGITRNVRHVSGGEIVRDGSGEPTGLLRGKAIDLVRSVIPQSHTRDWPAVAETATNYAASLGVTSVQDMSVDDHAEVYRKLERQGKLKTRVYDCIGISERPGPAARVTEKNSGMVRQGCLKSFAEGDPEADSKLKEPVRLAKLTGWQVMLHAIGPATNAGALTIFEGAGKVRLRDARFRIEHAHNADPGDIRRFAKSGVIASVQPLLFLGSAGGHYRELLDSGAILALGSDAPMAGFDPLGTVHAARIELEPGSGLSLSVYEAVRAYTYGSAYAEFQEREKGTLEEGKIADFIIVTDDIFSIEPSKIPDARVLMTVVDGKVVFASN